MSERIRTVDPATGRPIATYEGWDAARTEAAVERAHAAALAWAPVPVAERATRARQLARTLREHGDRLARLATTEMGKPISEAAAEVEKSAVTAEFLPEGPRPRPAPARRERHHRPVRLRRHQDGAGRP